jgi:hypothetical protein
MEEIMPRSWKISSRRALALFLIACPLLTSSGAGNSARHPAQTSYSHENGPGRPYSFFERLYKDHRYFELRDAVEQIGDLPAPEMEFYRGAVDEVFNRLDSAVAHLWTYLEGGAAVGLDRPLAQEAFALLRDAYRRAGQYRKSAEIKRLVLERYGAGPDAVEKANLQSQSGIWSALADVPPQTVEVLGASDMAMENRNFPVRIKDRIFYFGYDTGSTLSVLYQSAAEELGLALLGQGIKVQAATGKRIDARLAVVPEMRLGQAIIRNAVFLVLPDDSLRLRQARNGVERRGLIGAPVLAALKEITETRDGHLVIPASPQPRPVQNMFFFGTKPIIEVVHRGARLLFNVDTGASLTSLYPTFFRLYRGEIQSRTRPVQVTMYGVGDERTVSTYILDEFAFEAAGRDFALREVMVHTQVTHSITDIFHGRIGLDVLKHCSRMTFNFESMSFILE